MFIVVPYLSADQSTYGVYAVCISVTVFLSYADLGFLGAGMKYAAESHARGDTQKEIELVGFSHFILLIFVLLFSAVFLYLSFNPDLLIRDLQTGEQQQVASKLLLILALFTPTTVIQRMLQMIFSIRLEEYNLQKINIVGSVVKIASVFFFFGNGRYDIVGYYLFLQIVSLIVAIVGIWLARRNYQYDFKLLFSKIRFSRSIFIHTKSLAFSSLFATLSWVLYYELDSVAIGKMLGASSVAIYAIGLTMLGFLRSLLGVFFSPFSARFNHFIGMGQIDEMRGFVQHVMTITFPIVVFPLVAVSIMAPGIVISWVGDDYQQSIVVVRWLVLCNVLGFVSYPAGMLLVAREKMRQMYVVNIIMPVIFWGGIIATVSLWGVESFAVFKFVTFVVSAAFYTYFSLQFIDVSLWVFVKRTVIPYAIPLAAMIGILLLLQDSCMDGKNKLYLLANVAIAMLGILTAMLISLFTCRPMREYAKRTIKLITKR